MRLVLQFLFLSYHGFIISSHLLSIGFLLLIFQLLAFLILRLPRIFERGPFIVEQALQLHQQILFFLNYTGRILANL